MSRTFFAYHITHVFGPFGLDSYHTNSNAPRENDTVYVLSGDKDSGTPGVDYSLEGVFRIHRRIDGQFKLPSISGELREFKVRLVMTPIRVPDAPIPLAKASWYLRKEAHNYFSSGQNFNPLPTDKPYKERLDALLAGYGSNDAEILIEDLAELARTVPDATEREVLSKARIGQGQFRAGVVEEWGKGEVCVLTGIAIPEMLIASHIKPWRDSTDYERLDPMNGLLLVAHADKLFDRFLLSFVPKGIEFKSVIHPRVLVEAKKCGLSSGMILKTNMFNLEKQKRLENYLNEHYKRHMKLVNMNKPTQ